MIYYLDNLFVEVYYKIDESFYLLKLDKKSNNQVLQYKFVNRKWEESKIIDKTIFYNLIVNYSLYGLNSNELGDWVDRIFHKNDGYQTPIVLNPYRENGIIDINKENELSKDRLLSNVLLNNNLIRVGLKEFISLQVDEIKHGNAYFDTLSLNPDNEIVNKKFFKIIFDFFSNQKDIKNSPINIELYEITNFDFNCFSYILSKLRKMSNYYEIYFKFREINKIEFSIKESDLECVKTFLDEIMDDDSHIAFKIKQTINFIIITKLENRGFIKALKEKNDFFIKDYSQFINDISIKYNIKKEYLLPPPIFKIDYIFDNGSKFSQMSSGEKQNVYNINSIIYHLINLNSTFANTFERKYSNINVVLDEIEQYAHPEMQKKFLQNILSSIASFQFNYINSINIIFITHSPFILSDIPKQNVLFLENGEPKDYTKMNTFGANITDLLADSFFFSNDENKKVSLIGDFAKSKIQEVIEFLKGNETKISKEECKIIIKIIDEPLLSYKLLDMYEDKYGVEDSTEKELELLESLAKKHKKKITDA